jgi:light-independent protochlorophyllide reductase subunit B
MKLTVWTYEGPPHVGAMRIATSMRDLHYVLHAPQGDTYADLLFTMIERRDRRPPVTYTTFQARDLGGDTAELFKRAVRDAYARFQPQAMIVGASCTAELIQDDPGGLAASLALPIPVVPLELPSYSKKENWGASETFYQIVRTLAGAREGQRPEARAARPDGSRPRCNLLGPTALGFHCRDDVKEVTAILSECGVDVHVVAPLGASPADIARLGEAEFNVVMYPEIALTAATWLRKTFGQPMVTAVPIGVGGTRDFIRAVGEVAGVDVSRALAREREGVPEAHASASRLPWFSRSVDATYLTGKRVFVFGDGMHAIAAARIARDELGFEVVGLGTYSREMAREVRAAAQQYGLEALISDDYLEVERHVAEAAPELVLGTQMERHIAKRLGVPCAVISAPNHVQDVPARYAPQMGWEGANVIFDTWVHPLMMGLEEHLLAMFREDFEFHDGARPSHLHAATGDARRDATQLGGSPGEAAPAAQLAEAGDEETLREAFALRADATVSTEDEVAPEESGLGDAAVAPASMPVGMAATAVMPSAAQHGPRWASEAERELGKVPFFVRGKARRNTERFASERGIRDITVDVLYDAKAHFGR